MNVYAKAAASSSFAAARCIRFSCNCDRLIEQSYQYLYDKLHIECCSWWKEAFGNW